MNQSSQVKLAQRSDHRDPIFSEPYKRGYRNPPHLRDFIASAHGTKVATSTATALIDQISVVGILIATSAIATAAGTNLFGFAVTFLAFSVAVAIVARQLRGLENLVHEASHYNWSRKRRRLNDFLGCALAAIPVGAKLSDYRESHLRHHGRFGTAYDPDRIRYIELDIEDIGRSSLLQFSMGTLRRFHTYQLGWLRSVHGSSAASLAPVAWFMVCVFIPSWWWFGPGAGVVATAEWLVALLVALPLLRFVAEGSEHVYTGTDTVFDATVTNLGLLQRLVFHPHNDGYHTVHHLWPGIPHHRLRRVHRHLLQHDPSGYAHQLRHRTRVLQDSRVGIQAAREEGSK